MLSPQKSLKVNAFARDLVNGIIMQEIKEDKVQEDVLKSQYFKHDIKHGILKKVMNTALTKFNT